MPAIIIPSRRTRQPQTIVRPSSYWLSRGLVFLYNGATFVDHCANIPGVNNGEISRRGNVGGGIAADISGSQYLSWASRDALNLTGPLSIFWRGVFDATTGAYRNVITKAQTNGASDTPFESYLDTSSGKLLLFRAAATGFRSYTSNTSTPSAGVVTSIGAMFNSGDLASIPTVYIDKTLQSVSTGGTLGSGAVTGNTADLRIGRRPDNATQLDGGVELVALFSQALTVNEYLLLQRDPWGELFAPDPRRIYFGVSGGVTTTDAAIAGTQATDVGAITVEATTGAAIAGTQATDVGAVTVEATTGAAIAGTQASDIAAIDVTASTGQTDAAAAGTQASDVGAITAEATLGLALSGTQASDLGYIVVEATLPAAIAGVEASNVGAVTATTTAGVDAAIAGVEASNGASVVVSTSIWTDVGVSAATWSDVGGATSIWSDL